jgi:hypothetical protein
VGPLAFSCAQDASIGAAKRIAVESAAMNFLKSLLVSDARVGYEMLSSGGKASVSPDQLVQAIAAIKSYEPTNLAIEHTYFLELTGKSPGHVICSTDLSKPHNWEKVAATSVPEQAHVILSAEARNNKLAFSIWLMPEDADWRVQSFWMNVATLADKDSPSLWRLGSEQAAKGHNFNAALLLVAAVQIANRGPNFQLGISQAIAKDLSKLNMPPEIQGQPPFTWKNDRGRYKVMTVGPIAIAGKIYVVIAHEVSSWESDAQVDGWNKELLSSFKNRFPEYSDVFSGVIVRALEQGGNRSFGTVEEIPREKTPVKE